MTRLLKQKEVVARMGISKSTFQRLTEKPPRIEIGRTEANVPIYRYPEAELDEWLKAKGQQ